MPLSFLPSESSRDPREPRPSPASKRLAVFRKSPEGHAAREAAAVETALVSRLRAGDEAAFETLVRSYGPRMLAVARRYTSSLDDAEDLVQSAFVLVLRFIHRFEGASKLSTWLHRVVVNCALMRIRARRRRPQASMDFSSFEDGAMPEPASHGPSVVDELEQRETRDGLLRAIGRLPDTVRAAIRLRDVDGRSMVETSALLGRSNTALKSDIRRGRVALRTMLAANGDARDPWRRPSPPLMGALRLATLRRGGIVLPLGAPPRSSPRDRAAAPPDDRTSDVPLERRRAR